MILPVVTLALPQVAVIARLTRGSMIEALARRPCAHRARLRPAGADDRRHAFAAPPPSGDLLSRPAAAALLTGSVVVETIFGIPGIGRYFVQGALNRDYTLVMGTVMIVAVFVVVFNLIVDLLYAAARSARPV
jgi:oligopeptide transport system permease protein